jgi:hypothetical protein
MRQAHVHIRDRLVGVITEDENGYAFRYFSGFADAYPRWRGFLAQSFLSAEYKKKYLELLDANCSKAGLAGIGKAST